MSKISIKQFIYKIISSSWASVMIPAFIGAVVSFMTTTYLDNKNREINLRPYLNFGIKVLDKNPQQFGVVIKNLGKGPAIINKIAFKFDDEIYQINQNYQRDFKKDFLEKTKIDKVCLMFMNVDFLPQPGDSIFENTEIGIMTIPRQTHYTEFNEPLINDVYKRQYIYGQNAQHPENKIRATKYMIDKMYSDCRKSFFEFFSSNSYQFSINIEYHSLNDEKIYGVNEFYPIRMANVESAQLNDILMPYVLEIMEKVKLGNLSEQEKNLLSDLFENK